MKVENIETARELISSRSALIDVIDASERWKSGHFEFVEHCGEYPGRVRIPYLPELKEKMLGVIREEIEIIEKQLKEL